MKSFLTQPKTQTSLALSASLAILFITGFTLVDEKTPAVRAWLTATFTHHWVGKSVLGLLVFLVAWVILRALPVQAEERQVVVYAKLLTLVTIFSTAALVVFFAIEAIG